MAHMTVSLTVHIPHVNGEGNNISNLHHQLDGCLSHHIDIWRDMQGGGGVFFLELFPRGTNK